MEMARILFVDDDAAFRETAADILTKAGHEVIPESHFTGALKVLNSAERIDLLLTDLSMPRSINGFSLARMARLRRADLRILYISGNPPAPTQDGSKILLKPIGRAQLLEEVRLALEG
jgi:CheY-like chemotaxis protein